MPLVWNPATNSYVRTKDDAEQRGRDAASKRMQAQADMILAKRLEEDKFNARAGSTVETPAMAKARVNTENLYQDFKVEDAKRRQAAAAKAAKDAQERIWGRQGGMQAARGLEEQAKTFGETEMAKIAEAYAPLLGDVEAQRAAELRRLADAITAGESQVSSATGEFLSALPQTAQAYGGVPLLSLEQPQNPLLEALRTQGAGTQAIESQRALDMALSEQLRQLSQRSAQQYQATEQSYLDALRRAGTGAGAAGRQFLATQRPALEAAIGQSFSERASELAPQRRAEEQAVTSDVQDLLTKAIETRAETRQKYGPTEKPKRSTLPKTGGTNKKKKV